MALWHTLRQLTTAGVGPLSKLAVAIVRAKVIAATLGAQGLAVLGQLTNAQVMAQFLMTLGMDQVVVMRVASHQAAQHTAKALATQRTFILAVGAMAGLWTLLVAALAYWVDAQLFPDGTASYPWAVRWVAASLPLLALTGVATTLLQAHQRVGLYAQASAVVAGLTAGSTALLVYYYGLEGGVWAMVLGAAFNAVVAWWYVGRAGLLGPLLRLLPQVRFSRGILRRLLTFGVVAMAGSLALQAATIRVRSLVMAEADVTEAGYFQAAWTLYLQVQGLVMLAVNIYFTPQFAAAQTQGTLLPTLREAWRTLQLAAAPMLLALILFADLALLAVYTPELLAARPALQLVGVALFSRMLIALLSTVVVVGYRLRTWLLIDVSWAACFVGGTWVLYQWGWDFTGAYLVQAVGFGLYLGLYLWVVWRMHRFRLHLAEVAWVLGILASLVVALLLVAHWPLWARALAWLGWTVAYWAWRGRAEERQQVVAAIRKRLGRQ